MKKKSKVNRGEMKLVLRENGYWYICYGRNSHRSLRTADRALAHQLFEEEKRSVLQKGVAFLDKRARIRLKAFKEEYMRARGLQDLSLGTLDNDDLSLRRFIDIVGDLPLRLIDRKTIDHFKSQMLARKHKKTYINIMLRALRAAFNYALSEEYLDRNPFMSQPGKSGVLLRVDESLPRFLQLSEIEAILRVVKDEDFLLALNIYLYAGLRRAELMRLTVQDVDLRNGYLYIRKTKGKRDRAVPIHPELKEMLSAYIKTDVGPLFPRWRSVDTYSVMFRKCAQAAGVDARLHDLRHTFGSYLAMRGVDLKRIKELMGHRDLSTTEIYARLRKEELQPAINVLSFGSKK